MNINFISGLQDAAVHDCKNIVQRVKTRE